MNIMQSPRVSRGAQISSFVTNLTYGSLPSGVRDAARQALVDFLGVAVAGHDNEAVLPIRKLIAQWNVPGSARVFLGGRTTPALATLANGTMTHAMDLDDIHYMGGGHPSGPCWSASLAIAEHRDLSAESALTAFVSGYEVMARLGGGGMSGVGRTLQHHGFHPTSMFGRAGAAAAAGLLLVLTPAQIENAMGIAATTAGGLVGSFGTHSKPFHSGKSGMDGVLAAELSSNGFIAAKDLLEVDKGILGSFLKGAEPVVPPMDFEERWYVLENGFKQFASCRATHASAEAAQLLSGVVDPADIAGVTAYVNPIAIVCAGNPDPKTGLEGRFSLAFCIALGVNGYKLSAFDFNDDVLRDPRVANLIPKIECEAVSGQPEAAAKLDILLKNGDRKEASVSIVSGHHEKPLGWDGLYTKFALLTEPVIGASRSAELFEVASKFDTTEDAVKRVSALLAGE